MTNPDTWMLFDDIAEYSEEQINSFNHNWWSLDELNIDLSINQKELAWKYNLSDQEIFSLKTFSSEWYKKYNDWYKKVSSDVMFQSWVPFFLSWLNKLPKFEWKVFRWHKVKKKEFKNFSNFKDWDIFHYNTFFSSSRSKKVAESFMWDDYKVLFKIQTKKWINIEDFSFYPKEKELIFLPKTLFRIDKVEKDWNSLIINLLDL